MPPLLADVGESAYQIDLLQQIVGARGIILMVIIVLLAQSLVSWFIIVYKTLVFAKLRAQSANFSRVFWNSASLDDVRAQAQALGSSPLSRIFEAGYGELERLERVKGDDPLANDGLDNIQRSIQQVAGAEVLRLERLLPFLATTGSSAPFIGLFGTVWGIMNAFAHIRLDRPILESVTPYIAQALVTTAIGLLAAIPAVMAYNYFISKIRRFVGQMDGFSIDLVNIFRRHYG